MTARDEAIQAILDMPKRHMIAKLDGEFFGSVLDAIPGDVLVRLAIERGALIETAPEFTAGIYFDVATRQDLDDFPPLYRVVES